MKLEFIKDHCETFLCNYFKIDDLTTIEILINEINKRELEDKHFKFIITLDDIEQASYTSMLSSETNDLDGGDWLAKENIDESWMNGDQLRDDLSLDQKFYIRKAGFRHGLSTVKFDDVFDKILHLTNESRDEFIAANKNILSILNADIYLLKVPVDFCYEAIFAFPNGYFHCDLSPFENYYLARKLEEDFGYKLFGLGASYISFIKGPHFSTQKIDELLALLMKIYTENTDPELYTCLKDTITDNKLITLRYTE